MLLVRVFNVFLISVSLIFLMIYGFEMIPNNTIRNLFILNLLLVFAFLIRSVNHKDLAYLDLIFWVFMAGLIIIPGFMQVSRNVFLWNPVHSDDDVIMVLWVILIGMLSFFIGTVISLRYYSRKTTKRNEVFLFETNVKTPSLLLLLIPGLFYIVYLGPSFFFTSRGVVYTTLSNSGEYAGRFLMLARSLSMVSFIVAIGCCYNQFVYRSRKTKEGLLFAIILCFLISFTLINPISSARFWSLSFYLAIFILLTPKLTPVFKGAFVPISSVLFLALMGAIKKLAAGGGLISERGFSILNPFNSDSLNRYLISADFDNFQTSMNPLIYYSEVGYRYGYNLLSVAMFWVPRSIWPSKGTDSGMTSAEALGYEFTNLSVPIYAEFFAAFGFCGVFLGMLALGWFCAWMDRKYQILSQKKIPISSFKVFYACFAGFFIINLRGSLLGGMPQYGFVLLLSFLIYRYQFFRKFVIKN